MTSRPLIIAIDGPSGAGKGTVARALARALDYPHVDTGAMYRAVAWKALQQQVPLTDDVAVAAVAERAAFDLDGHVVIDGTDVTATIRTPEMDQAAASVARLARVRSVLVARQRRYADAGGVVMEGRDIGSVVFPSADVKFYLDASPDERARRRAADTDHAAGRASAAVDVVARDLAARDESDRTRAASPLTMAADAVYVDTTGVSVDEVVRRVIAIVRERLAE